MIHVDPLLIAREEDEGEVEGNEGKGAEAKEEKEAKGSSSSRRGEGGGGSSGGLNLRDMSPYPKQKQPSLNQQLFNCCETFDKALFHAEFNFKKTLDANIDHLTTQYQAKKLSSSPPTRKAAAAKATAAALAEDKNQIDLCLIQRDEFVSTIDLLKYLRHCIDYEAADEGVFKRKREILELMQQILKMHCQLIKHVLDNKGGSSTWRECLNKYRQFRDWALSKQKNWHTIFFDVLVSVGIGAAFTFLGVSTVAGGFIGVGAAALVTALAALYRSLSSLLCVFYDCVCVCVCVCVSYRQPYAIGIFAGTLVMGMIYYFGLRKPSQEEQWFQIRKVCAGVCVLFV
jgi:hypothetical protein